MTNVRTQAHSRRQHGSFEVTNVTLKTVARVCFVLGLISPASSQSSAASSLAAEDVYLKLQRVGLDKSRVYKVRDGAIDRAAIHISLDDGTIAFTADINGRITGAFFTGDGEILLTPPDRTERGSLAFFTGAAILEEKFSTAYFRFNDDVFDQVKTAFRTANDPAILRRRLDRPANAIAQDDEHSYGRLERCIRARRTIGRFLHRRADLHREAMQERRHFIGQRLLHIVLWIWRVHWPVDDRNQHPVPRNARLRGRPDGVAGVLYRDDCLRAAERSAARGICALNW